MIMKINPPPKNRLYYIIALILCSMVAIVFGTIYTNTSTTSNVSNNYESESYENHFLSLSLAEDLQRKDLPNINFAYTNLYKNSFQAISVTLVIPDGSPIHTFKVRAKYGKLFTTDVIETIEFIGDNEQNCFIYQMPDFTHDRIDFEFLSDAGEILAQISLPADSQEPSAENYEFKIHADLLLEFLPSEDELLVLEPEIAFDKLELNKYNNPSTYITIQLPEGYTEYKIESKTGTLGNLVNKEFYGNKDISSVKYINTETTKDELVFWFFPENPNQQAIKRIVFLKESRNSRGDIILKILQ